MEQVVFWSRLGFCYDPPLYGEDGFPLVFDRNFSELKYHQQMYEAGVEVHSFILHSGWVGDGVYDYRLTDKVMETAAKIGENAKFLLRVKLNAPIDWCRKHPRDVFVYDPKLCDEDEISSLCGTLEQDYLGYESPNGYYMQNDPAFKRPNVGGRIALQSFSSEQWLRDGSEALARLIEHLEPYRDRIVGYHLAWGACGEAMLWGRQNRRFGDFGINHRLKFWDHGVEKYGDPRRVWGLSPSDTRESYHIPSGAERYDREGLEFYRSDPIGVMSRDLDEFMCDANVNAAERFGKVAKTLHPGAKTGIFYGYYLFIPTANYTGHLGLDRILKSEWIDFLSAPKSYAYTKTGEPGGEMCPSSSINRSKKWIEELDVRTHLAGADTPPMWRINTLEESKVSLAREMARNLSRGSGFWWMDLGGGWFDDLELLKWITKLNKTAKELEELPSHSTSDVLVLTDEKSLLNAGSPKESDFPRFFRELALTGARYDSYRTADLEGLELSRYRAVIFEKCYLLTPEELELVLNRSKARIVLGEDCGILREGKCSREYCAELRELCGERLSTLNEAISGCDLVQQGTFVYGDDRFTAIFSTDREVELELKLPFDSWREIFTNEVGEGNIVRMKLAPKSGRFYVINK